jgi:hypothetical protein
MVMTRPVDSFFFKSLELYSWTGLATGALLQVGGGLAPRRLVNYYVTTTQIVHHPTGMSAQNP